MKTIKISIFIALILVIKETALHAQAWQKNSHVFSIGFGASKFYHLDDYYYGNSHPVHNYYRPVTGQLNFQGEFGIHPYVGLGFTTGAGGRGGWTNDYNGEFNIPVGMLSNFHFYQLISDKSKKNIHADKMDIYAGLSIGSGIAFTYYPNDNRAVPIAFGGVHAGIRYYFSDKVGVNAEIGLGKNLINAGFVFRN